VPDGEGSNLIEAAVILGPDIAIEIGELLDYLAGRLPSYAVPAKVIVMADFPRTSTGKINRRELQAQAAVRSGSGHSIWGAIY
jgi:acyl-coenzyme A synthetase/AMP-(fatty) acid ligase